MPPPPHSAKLPGGGAGILTGHSRAAGHGQHQRVVRLGRFAPYLADGGHQGGGVLGGLRGVLLRLPLLVSGVTHIEGGVWGPC